MSRFILSTGAFRFVLAAALSCAGLRAVRGQTPAADSFDPYASGSVYALALQPDGSLLVGGQFSWIGGAPRNYLARVAADGTVDGSFNPGPSGRGGVLALAVQPDGGIVVGGSFTGLGGASRTNLGRLHADGSVDNDFNPGAGGQVNALALQADGKILVGGDFTSLGGAPQAYLGRLNADGSVDTNFSASVGGGQVLALALQPDGKILVGGWFTGLGNSGPAYFGRLNANGSLDASFQPNANYTVEALAVEADGRILAGGGFTVLGGSPRRGIGRVDGDGNLDATFDPSPNGTVYALALQADRMIVVGGHFGSLGGDLRPNIGRVDTNGVLDAGFNPGVDVYTYALAQQTDGKLVVGGAFNTLGGQSRMNLGRLNATGPATNLLTCDGATITWLRGGTAPEVCRTTFETTTNGMDWTLLGAGARIEGGWQLGGLSGSPGFIRARGYTSSGMYNGSGGIMESTAGQPIITAPPVACTNAAGTMASFTVAALGPGPLFYQWRHEGVELANGGSIDGATGATLNVSDVLGADAGGYDVLVSNVYGCATSAVAVLTVLDPTITGDPASQNAERGSTCMFSVSAVGTDLAYQWRKGGWCCRTRRTPR